MNKFIFFFCFAPLWVYAKLEEKVYSKKIKSIQFYIYSVNNDKQSLNTPNFKIGSDLDLKVEFDWIDKNPIYGFECKIIHCNRNWEKSNLLENQFTNEINQVMSYHVENSITFGLNYFHCSSNIPKPSLSGNYMLQVTEIDNPDNILFTRKFLAYENKVYIKEKEYSATNYQKNKQSIDFEVTLGKNYPFDFQDFTHVSMRKNERWDLQKELNQANSINPFDHSLSYNANFNNNKFDAGNEYITLDISDFSYKGIADKLLKQEDTSLFILSAYIPFRNSYYNYFDIDGKFYTANYNEEEGDVHSEYVKVKFILDYKLETKDEVFVIGAFNNWECNQTNKLIFNPSTRMYEKTIWLKQGYYNYKFIAKNSHEKKESFFMGDFIQTTNTYDIIIYYYDQLLDTDKIIGFKNIRFPN